MAVSKKKTPLPKLSKVIRDEIRMTCALKGFSTLIHGNGKNNNRQFDQMFHFYHGKKPHRPSQIEMLCKGHGSYRALYNLSQVTVTSKNGSTESVNRLFLKPSLHLDLNFNYRADIELVTEDLERKTVNNPLLVTGRCLHVLAKKGVSFYRKALSFASKKWDVKKNEPIESGCNVDDVIDYVRREMYNEMYDIQREDSDIDDDYNELDEVDDATSNRDEDKEKNDGEEINNETEDTCAEPNPKPPSPKDSQKAPTNKRIHDDDIPNNWFFPGFFAFVIFGPFADPNDRLACFEIEDLQKAASRAAKRRAELIEKEKDRANDDHNKRGFTADQKINMEALTLQRIAHEQTTKESNLVALIAHESAIGRQIKASERRAFVRCKEYDASNMFWKQCDDLINKQVEITENIAKFTMNINPTNGDDEKKKSIEDFIGSDSESLFSPNKRPSPSKKKKGRNKNSNDNTDANLALLSSDSESDVSKTKERERDSESTAVKPIGYPKRKSSPRKEKRVSN